MMRLPVDADVYYVAQFLAPELADALYAEITASFDVTDRMVQMADGSQHEAETSSHLFTEPHLTSYESFHETWGARSAWTPLLAEVRAPIEATTGVRFQVARCIYYRDGSEGVDFHHDLPAYGLTDQIASLSLGAEREFVLRGVADPTEQHSIRLASGSLLFMGKGCQERYQHALPHDDRCTDPRINLTFRKYGLETINRHIAGGRTPR